MCRCMVIPSPLRSKGSVDCFACFFFLFDAGSFGDSAKAEDHEIDRCDSAPAREGPPASQGCRDTVSYRDALCGLYCIACEQGTAQLQLYGLAVDPRPETIPYIGTPSPS